MKIEDFEHVNIEHTLKSTDTRGAWRLVAKVLTMLIREVREAKAALAKNGG